MGGEVDEGEVVLEDDFFDFLSLEEDFLDDFLSFDDEEEEEEEEEDDEDEVCFISSSTSLVMFVFFLKAVFVGIEMRFSSNLLTRAIIEST